MLSKYKINIKDPIYSFKQCITEGRNIDSLHSLTISNGFDFFLRIICNDKLYPISIIYRTVHVMYI